MIRAMVISMCLLVAGPGCEAQRKPVNVDYMLSYSGAPVADQNASASLFPSDEKVLDGETIRQILDTPVEVSPNSRLAIVQFGDNWGAHWWSPQVAKLEQAALEEFIQKVEKCPRIKTAAILPSIMAPRVQSIPYLRAAAARYQANLILVFRTTGRSYTQSKMLAQDRIRAYCMVEAVLIDTLTGIIPFTSVVARDFDAEKSRDDYSLTEAVQKAHTAAFQQAMAQIGDELAAFLTRTPG